MTMSEQLIKAILEFDCPECAKLDRCIDSLECRLYAQGRIDAAARIPSQQSLNYGIWYRIGDKLDALIKINLDKTVEFIQGDEAEQSTPSVTSGD
jgi:hypothetical protein